jgi:hypothetical protein
MPPLSYESIPNLAAWSEVTKRVLQSPTYAKLRLSAEADTNFLISLLGEVPLPQRKWYYSTQPDGSPS